MWCGGVRCIHTRTERVRVADTGKLGGTSAGTHSELAQRIAHRVSVAGPPRGPAVHIGDELSYAARYQLDTSGCQPSGEEAILA